MTIDEMIKSVRQWHQGMRNGKRTAIDIVNALKELQWYREQDLIQREDVISIISGCADNCKYDSCVDCEAMRLYEIPKAKYGGERGERKQ